MRIKSLFLVMLICVFELSAQESHPNLISLGFGGSNLHVLDEHANYLIFRGTGISPSVNYSHRAPKGIHLVNGAFYLNKLTTSADNFRTKILGGEFRYAYLRNITVNPIGFSMGLTVSSIYFKTNYSFYNSISWLRAIESWYWSHSAGLAFQLRKESDRNKFILNAFVPVISNVSRPKYSSSGDYNYETNDWQVSATGKTLFLTENPGIDARMIYSRQLSTRLTANAEYEFLYAHCRNPELFRLYINNFRVGLSYSF